MRAASIGIAPVVLACLLASSCADKGPAEVQVEIRSVGMDRASGAPVVVLQDLERHVALPIWIGVNEAQAIAMQMEGITPPRPMTHDLMKNVLDEAGVSMERVVIAGLRDNTYFAQLHLRAGGRDVSIDSRPSDAIALAVRFQRPIFIARALFEGSAGVDLRRLEAGEAVHLRGVTVQALSAELADYFGLRPGEGVLVSGVADGVTALQRGDVIVAVSGMAVVGVSDFADKIAALESSPAPLSVQRGDSRIEVHLDNGAG